MQPARLRFLGLLLAIGGLVVLCISIPAMLERLSEQRRLSARPYIWFGEPVTESPYFLDGEPVTFETVTRASTATEPSRDVLVITYRGRTAELPVAGRDDPRLPGLMRYGDWLKVLPMAEGSGSTTKVSEDVAAGALKPRLIVAARYLADDYAPDSWGTVRRKEWRYRFVELDPAAPPEEAIRTSDFIYADLEKQPLLWQYQAMLQVTPPLMYPRNRFIDDNMHAMGWTWPAASLSIMSILIGLTLVGASFVRGWRAPTTAHARD